MRHDSLLFVTEVLTLDELIQRRQPILRRLQAANKPAQSIANRILLLGYYLVNLGYATYSVSFWNHVSNPVGLAEELSLRLGLLISGLACLHYFNLYAILKFRNAIQILLKQYL